MLSDSMTYLTELRLRFMRMLIVFAVVFSLCALYANTIYQLLTLPLIQHFSGPQALIAIAITSPLVVPLKSAACVAVLISLPYLFYELWAFIVPALYKKEKQSIRFVLCSSIILFYLGCLFAYCVVLPLIFRFFLAIAPAGVEVKPDIALYFSFIVRLMFAFGAAFELPVVVVFLILSHVVTPESLASKRGYVVVIAFIVGMLLTPPDVISQILLAVPLCILFEAGLLVGRLLMKRRVGAIEY